MGNEGAHLNSNIVNYLLNKTANVLETYGADNVGQRREIYDLLLRSVETAESNSLIVCGPPGSGKTSLLKNTIKTLNRNCKVDHLVVRLNGLLHTDDRLALQAITGQLGQQQNETKTFSSFQENLVYLLECLKGRNKRQSYVIFILDEIHLFCDHKNQILLYNLFDICQSSKAPICVIGITHCVDIMDLMEKRVLSRFSHRVINLQVSHSIEKRLELLKELLIVNEDFPELRILKVMWNVRLDSIINNKEVKNIINHHMNIDSSYSKLVNDCCMLLTRLPADQPLITVELVKEVFMPVDYTLMTLKSMSLLELGLVLAIKQHSFNYDREPFNFEMVYLYYLKFVKKSCSNLISEKSVLYKVFQRLIDLEFVIPLKNIKGKTPSEYQLYRFTLTDEQVMEAVKQSKEVTTKMKEWVFCEM